MPRQRPPRRRSAASAPCRSGRPSAAVRPAARRARSTSARPSSSARASSTDAGIAVAGEEALQPQHVGVPGAPTRIEPAPPASIRPTRRRINARMMISPISAEPIISARRCAASNGRAVQPSGPARPAASVPRPDSWLTSPVNWPAPCVVIVASCAEAVAADDDRALEHQPGGRVALADVEHRLAGRESPRRPAGESPRGLDLRARRAPGNICSRRVSISHCIP